MKENRVRRVFGFTLSIAGNCIQLTKRLFDVNVGNDDEESKETPFVLFSPQDRTRARIISDEELEEDDPKFRMGHPKRDYEIIISCEQWNDLRKGKVICQSKKKAISKYLSFDLEAILNIPGVKDSFEDWQITSIRKGYIDS